MSFDLVAPQPLTLDHRCADFSCGEPLLDEWLKRRAMANQLSGASRTFVVADSARRVYGYYAMAAGAVSHQLATGGVRRNMPDPVPVMVLARLQQKSKKTSHSIMPKHITNNIWQKIQMAIVGLAAPAFHAPLALEYRTRNIYSFFIF